MRKTDISDLPESLSPSTADLTKVIASLAVAIGVVLEQRGLATCADLGRAIMPQHEPLNETDRLLTLLGRGLIAQTPEPPDLKIV